MSPAIPVSTVYLWKARQFQKQKTQHVCFMILQVFSQDVGHFLSFLDGHVLPSQPKGQGQSSTWLSAKAVSPPIGPQYPSGLDKLMVLEWQLQQGRLGSTYIIAYLSLGVLHPLTLMKHSFLSIPFSLPSTKTYHLPSRMFTYSHFVNNLLLSTNCNINSPCTWSPNGSP